LTESEKPPVQVIRYGHVGGIENQTLAALGQFVGKLLCHFLARLGVYALALCTGFRLDGVAGLKQAVFALVDVAYVVGSPDRPTPTSSAAEVASYFGTAPGSFVLGNGVVAVFSTFFFLWFLGALRGLLRRAEGEEGGFFSSAALAGGTLFITLSCAGYVAEVVYPAAVLRFENFAPASKQLSRLWSSRRGSTISARSALR
jgi:hypothetical protein